MRKTKTVDVSAELAELRHRIESLEARLYPAQVAPMSQPMGCVCPAGAEFGCYSPVCPRKRPPGYFTTTTYG